MYSYKRPVPVVHAHQHSWTGATGAFLEPTCLSVCHLTSHKMVRVCALARSLARTRLGGPTGRHIRVSPDGIADLTSTAPSVHSSHLCTALCAHQVCTGRSDARAQAARRLIPLLNRVLVRARSSLCHVAPSVAVASAFTHSSQI